ncbi:hypothetical protein MFLO_15042 [Listeria floridensis FSL S10-1187]|uniref:Uncharacterized protein n=1 Tax=Listeria floridensis FSL S10-1187 TaxID=1265817 RepID=A0ABP3AU39_9LIST|nr:hypothetical protein [Listeria floridensis]EUJ25653.1 hypothetical protein MFLO_15042 [Listeria floridensis FSL S10-1187]
MVYAVSLQERTFPTNPLLLQKKPEVDPIEQESFFITLQDAIKREWLVRLAFFEEADVAKLELASFEDSDAFVGRGMVQELDAVPVEIDPITQEILFCDGLGQIYPIQFNDIVTIELL